ncbi:MAG: hypothetical protein AB7E70_20165 [Hyphomicrobiaceae bacterium]
MEQGYGPIYGPEGEQFKIYDSAKSWNIPYKLGQELIIGERRWRFARAGATALAAGKVYQSEVPDANFDTLAVPTAAVVGQRYIDVTLPANSVAADLWAQGYAVIEAAAGSGPGRQYKVKTHVGSAGSETLRIYLEAGDGLQTALTTADKVTMIKSPYADVIIHPAPPTALVVGVPNAAIPATDYGWLQVGGPCPVLVVGTMVIGGGVIATGTVTGSPDGSAEAAGVGITTTAATIAQITEVFGAFIGRCIEVAPTTGYGSVWLMLP